MSEEEIKELLDDAEICPRLTHWEMDFCQSIRDQMAQDRELSDKQISTLQSIQKKVYMT